MFHESEYIVIIVDNVWNFFIMKYKGVQHGSNLKIAGFMHVHGKKNGLRIGDNVKIWSKASVNPTSGFNHSSFRTEQKGSIEIGNNVGLSHVNITSYESIIIEDNVRIGSGVKIWDTDFHSLDYEDRINEDRHIKSKPIRVCEGAFIGACSIILKGVTIGRHSIIGAGSVVTKDVPDGEIWAGNPAQFIRRIESVEVLSDGNCTTNKQL